MTTVINSFKGEHGFLSNFDTAPFYWRGIKFKSGEEAFNWAKGMFLTPGNSTVEWQNKVLATATPSRAKYVGRSMPLDTYEWDKRRIGYMRDIVHAKFGYVKDYAGKLINTGASPLVEGNDWGDTFWGKCRVDGKIVGLNMLGTILMEERGYWLWYGQANSSMVGSGITTQHVERTLNEG